MKSQGHVSTRNTHDVIVIGGGSAGYAAARTARDDDDIMSVACQNMTL